MRVHPLRVVPLVLLSFCLVMGCDPDGGDSQDAGTVGGSDAGQDSGTLIVDAGTTRDAGTTQDSGTLIVDAGTDEDSGTPIVVDAGTGEDSGTPIVDAGTNQDAGTTPQD